MWMFVMRLSYSGRAFHIAFSTQAQEAFLQGHVAAFTHLGAVPGRVRYDNLKPAVVRVLRGRDVMSASGHRAAQPLRFRHVLLRRASTARMRRAAWRVRSAGSAAAIWCRSRRWAPSRS